MDGPAIKTDNLSTGRPSVEVLTGCKKYDWSLISEILIVCFMLKSCCLAEDYESFAVASEPAREYSIEMLLVDKGRKDTGI